jgi:hypothetical protein
MPNTSRALYSVPRQPTPAIAHSFVEKRSGYSDNSTAQTHLVGTKTKSNLSAGKPVGSPSFAHVCVCRVPFPPLDKLRHCRSWPNRRQRGVHVGHPPGSSRLACRVGVAPTVRGLVRLAWHVTWFTLVFTILFFS